MGTGSVKDFKALINSGVANGVAKGCHYYVTISPPTSMYEGTRSALSPLIAPMSQLFPFMAESCSLPGRQLLTTEHKIFGTLRKMPYGVQYEDMTITFICSTNMMERAFFDIWHQYIISPQSQYMEYYNSYVGQIVIYKVSDSGTDAANTISSYVLEEAYPVSILAQDLNASDTEYLRLTVQFAYSKWKCVFDQFVERGSGVGAFS